MHPYVIYISKDPLAGAKGGRDLVRRTRATAGEQHDHRPGSFLEDALAPVWVMMNTRGAHDSQAQLALREEQGYRDEEEFFFFGLTSQAIPLPLGWKLSGTAVREMNRQADGPIIDKPDEKIDGKNNPRVYNPRVFSEVSALLK